MQIDKINNVNRTPNFQAKIVMEPELVERLIGKRYDKVSGQYVGLINFKYSPLDQRKILYRILKHIKKDKTHKLCELGGGWFSGKDHVWMRVDGKLGDRWTCFSHYSDDSCRSDYIQRILTYAGKLYPKADFTGTGFVDFLTDKINGLFRKIKNSQTGAAKSEYDILAEKIENLLKEDNAKTSFCKRF